MKPITWKKNTHKPNKQKQNGVQRCHVNRSRRIFYDPHRPRVRKQQNKTRETANETKKKKKNKEEIKRETNTEEYKKKPTNRATCIRLVNEGEKRLKSMDSHMAGLFLFLFPLAECRSSFFFGALFLFIEFLL